jgi:predicted nucleic acid-binding protein
LTLYADTSVLVSSISPDDHTSRARRWLAGAPRLIVSGWAVAEFGAVVRRQARVGRLDRDGVATAETALQAIVDQPGAFRPVLAADVGEAGHLVRRYEPLRAPDALHLAVALRLGFPIVTFDTGLAEAAEQAGIGAVIP